MTGWGWTDKRRAKTSILEIAAPNFRWNGRAVSAAPSITVALARRSPRRYALSFGDLVHLI